MKTPRRIYALLVASVLGLALSLYLAYHFFEVRSGIAGFRSLCNFGSGMDCNVVTASPYARGPFGIPLAGFGAGWFTAALVLAVWAINRFWRREVLRLLTVWSLAGILAGFVYLWIMLARVGTVCVYCLGMDLMMLTIGGLTLSLRPEPFHKPKLEWRKWRVLGAAMVVSFVATATLTLAFNSYTMPDQEITKRVEQILSAPQATVHSGPEFPSIGSDSAPITIVEFSDFQCPYCRLGAFILHTVQMQYPKDVRIVFRNFPLDPRCNAQVKHSMHAVACTSAQVSICGHLAGRFAKTYETLFENQALLAAQGPVRILEKNEVVIPDLEKCIQSPEVATRIRSDVDEAVRLGIQSTRNPLI